jgi:hypothetical protein
MTTDPATPTSRDIVDVRLLDAMAGGGCPVCAVRTRSERATMDTIIDERVLDIGFREDLERRTGFCRRHVAELVATDRRRTGGILGSSLLLAAIIDRRLAPARDGLRHTGRRRRASANAATKRPPCIACSQGEVAARTAIERLAERTDAPDWVTVIAEAPFCLDDLLAFWAVAGGRATVEPVMTRQLERFAALRDRLNGFADHSSHDRRHLMTDDERTAADEATRLLGGG